MFKMLKSIIFSLVALTAVSGSAAALTFGGGSYYDYVSFSGTWAEARADALSQTCHACGDFPLQGYLANITSQEENDLLATFGVRAWIGGTDEAEEGTWVWADGPEAGTAYWVGLVAGSAVDGAYENWNDNEPNQWRGTEEDYAEFYTSGRWNDLTATHTRSGYFVEYSPAGVAAIDGAVPLPAGFPLMLSAMAGLVWVRRRKG